MTRLPRRTRTGRFQITLLALSLGQLLSAADPLPNVLWITAEDMSPNLGCYGDRYADTPHLDQLAAEGTRYTRFFAESPMCAPSRATIITGMHNGPLGASQMRSLHRVPDFVRPFTAWLREAGYYCVNNSKTDYNLARNASNDNAEFVHEGWDESSPSAHWRNRASDQPFFCVLNYTDTHQSRASRDDYAQFAANVQSRLPRKRIHDPALVALPPHYPDSSIARRTIARYYDCITTLDDFVGRTLADLKSDGLAETTIVCFYSDHGAGLPTGKACVSDFGLRVPLIVHFPEKFSHLAPGPAGTVDNRLVCFADLAPTVLNLAGIKKPAHMHGTAFLGENLSAAPEFVLGSRDRMDETLETTRWISDGRYLLVRAFRRDMTADQQSLTSRYNGNGELCQEIRTLAAKGKLNRQQRHFWQGNRPGVRLFDSEADPWNLHDLAAEPSQRQRLTQMEQALNQFMLSERDLGFWPEPELAEAEKTASAHEVARLEPGRYPLEQLLETARLEEVSELSTRLTEENAAVRYWAVLGLASLGAKARAALPALRSLLADPAASVRIEAAHLLAKLGDSETASLDLLAYELDSENDWTAARAARALELLGEKARPKLSRIDEVLKERTSGFFLKPTRSRPANYGLEFSLLSALEGLGEQPLSPP